MKAIIGKQIGDIKVTRVNDGIVTYSKKVWQGSWRRTISRLKMEEPIFCQLYPRNCN
jgi:hypothetical protein